MNRVLFLVGLPVLIIYIDRSNLSIADDLKIDGDWLCSHSVWLRPGPASVTIATPTNSSLGRHDCHEESPDRRIELPFR